MAVTITILDPAKQTTRTIICEVYSTFIETDVSAALDFYVQLSTTARRVNGTAVPTHYIRALNDLAIGGIGGTQFGSGSSDPYDSLEDAINDYVLLMVKGNGTGQAMAF